MEHVQRIVDMLRSGMTLGEIETAERARRQAELAAMEREHRQRMWRDVTLPFLVGMSSLVWVVGVVWCGGPIWLSLVSMPGVAWCQWKLVR